MIALSSQPPRSPMTSVSSSAFSGGDPRGHLVYLTTAAKVAVDPTGVPKLAKIRKYLSPKILVIDEITYRPLNGRANSAIFLVVSERYETDSITCSYNKSFTKARSSAERMQGSAEIETGSLMRGRKAIRHRHRQPGRRPGLWRSSRELRRRPWD